MKLVQGVGTNDADYNVNPTVDGKQVMCPFYNRWHDMLQRCYSAKLQVTRPTYAGCSVVEEWHSFSNFRSWMVEQDWEGKHLDKDLLVEGNKVYGPDTCAFVSGNLNKLLTDASGSRGALPIGVVKKGKGYQAQINKDGKRIYLGTFKTPGEAHNVWRKAKAKIILNSRELTNDIRVKKSLTQKAEELANETY